MTTEQERRSKWYVTIGNHYVAGLGQTYEGYHRGDHIAVTPGIVITRLAERAMEFTSRREAAALARSIEGQVIRV